MANQDDQLVSFGGRDPRLGRDVYVAPGARLVGDVTVGDRGSIWFNAVLRGDINRVVVGAGSNIQDGCILHVDDDAPCLVGNDVVVGHGAILHGCSVADRCLIGMGSVLLNGVHVGEGSVIAAGALVPPGTSIPPGHLAMGLGAKVVKPLPPDFWARDPLGAAKYRRLADTYRTGVAWRWPDPEWDRRDAEDVAGRQGPGDSD